MIKIPDLMLLNKVTDRKFELGGGFTTDPKYLILIFIFSRPSSFPGGWLRPGLWGWSMHQKGEQVEINKNRGSLIKKKISCATALQFGVISLRGGFQKWVKLTIL